MERFAGQEGGWWEVVPRGPMLAPQDLRQSGNCGAVAADRLVQRLPMCSTAGVPQHVSIQRHRHVAKRTGEMWQPGWPWCSRGNATRHPCPPRAFPCVTDGNQAHAATDGCTSATSVACSPNPSKPHPSNPLLLHKRRRVRKQSNSSPGQIRPWLMVVGMCLYPPLLLPRRLSQRLLLSALPRSPLAVQQPLQLEGLRCPHCGRRPVEGVSNTLARCAGGCRSCLACSTTPCARCLHCLPEGARPRWLA